MQAIMKPTSILNKQFIQAKPSVHLHSNSLKCHRKTFSVSAVAEPYTSPSSRTGATELQALERFSEVVPDVLLNQTLQNVEKPKAASSSRSILAGIMANPASFGRYKFAIEQARYYSKPNIPEEDRTAFQVDKALINVGSIMLENISGRVSTEVDPRFAHNTEKLIARGRQLVALYAEDNIPKDRFVLRMPATWEAIQATKVLESEGIACHLTSINSFVQALAGAQAGASVLQINVGRLADWYIRNPGVLYDKNAPREARVMAKAGYGAAPANPGILLVEKVYSYLHQNRSEKTKLMVSGMRTKGEALAVAGADFLVVGPRVLQALEQSITLEGYNDGLRATDQDSGAIKAALTPACADAYEFSPLETAAVDQAMFSDQLGMAGKEILNEDVKRLVDDADRLEPLFLNRAGGQE